MRQNKTDIPPPPPPQSDEYRLVVYRSEDFSEVRAINLTLSNMYRMASILMLILIALIASILIFTPLKRLIPGYGKIESNQKFLQVIEDVDHLTGQIEAQEVYIGSIRTFLSNGLGSSDSLSANISDVVIPTKAVKSPVVKQTIPIQVPQSNQIELDSDQYGLLDVMDGQRLVKPVSGLVSSKFDPSIKHYGVDVLAPSQTAIVAMMDGIVFSSGWDLETGYTIGIQHNDNILSFYKHNSQLLKEKGTFVSAGEAVAIIGSTGTMSSGPHLHFEIWHQGRPVDPEDILNFN